MYRRQVGLSQKELALLAAVEHRGSFARFELGTRLPGCDTVIALELVLGQPVQTLFAGLTEQIRDDLACRAQALLESLGDKPTKEAILKLDLLSRLAHPDDERIMPLWEDDK